MPWEVNYLAEDNITIITCTGKISIEDIKEQTRVTIVVSREKGTDRVMADYYNALLDISIADLYLIPQIYGKMEVPIQCQIAVVMPQHFLQLDLYHFFETVCQNRNYNVRLFNDHDSAKEWLKVVY